MKLASYYSTRPGIKGLGNVLIRIRLQGQYSHSEIVFEPGDGVDHLMPDGSTEPVNGAYWCASSVSTEILPEWSKYRAGKMGGVRFKRIVLDPARWTLDNLDEYNALEAAGWATINEGALYDWQLILGFIAWIIPDKTGRVMCSEGCATMLGFLDPWRFDPCVLQSAVRGRYNLLT